MYSFIGLRFVKILVQYTQFYQSGVCLGLWCLNKGRHPLMSQAIGQVWREVVGCRKWPVMRVSQFIALRRYVISLVLQIRPSLTTICWFFPPISPGFPYQSLLIWWVFTICNFFLSLWLQSLLPKSTCGMSLYNALLSFFPSGRKVSYQYLHVGWSYTMLCFLSLPLATKSPTKIYM